MDPSAAEERRQVRAWLQYYGFNPDDPRQRSRPADHQETDNHPRHRGWIIPHPRFPLGFKHFLDPHQQATRLATLRVPWVPGLALPFDFEQRALHAWTPRRNHGSDDTGQVLWRAAEVLSDYVLLKYAAPVRCHAVPALDWCATAAAGGGGGGGGVSCGGGGSSSVGGGVGLSGFRPRRVVELGCGACPLPSLAAGVCGHRVVGTDLPAQLVLAQRNVDANAAALVPLHLPLPPPPHDEDASSIAACSLAVASSASAPTSRNAATPPAVYGRHADRPWLAALDVSLAPLPWGAPLPPDAWWAQPGGVDLVLCSDVLYALPGQPAFFKELAATLGLLFRGAPAHAVAVFAYQRRSGVEQRFFDVVLPAAGFVCTDMTNAAAAAGVGTQMAAAGAAAGASAATGLLAQGMIRVIEVRPAV